MVELNELCVPGAQTLDQLWEGCNGYGRAWGSSALKIGLTIGAAVLAAAALVIQRLVRGEAAGAVVLSFFEGLSYGAIGCWAGASAGTVLALFLPPAWVGVLFAILAGIALFVVFWALIKGDAGLVKIAGCAAIALLLLFLVLPTAFAFLIDREGPAREAFGTYVLWVSVTFALTGWAGALIAGMFRGYFYGLGLIIVLVNASWGLVGNILGLLNHLASIFFFKDWGDVEDKRSFYVHYKSGFHLKANYDFTWGDAVSGSTVEKHESIHVLQHLLFGPIFPFSHALWAVLLFVPGLIAGAVARSDAGKGVMDFSYYNNPWEVIAYAFQGTRNDDPRVDQPLIWNDIAAWIVTALWVLCATAALIVFLLVRT